MPGSATAGETVAVSGRAMGTTWSAKWVETGTVLNAASIKRDLVTRLEQWEQIFSSYRPHSELSRFNAAESTEWIPVARELATVVDASWRISERTNGAYDVTVFPLLQLWGLGGAPAPALPPSPEAVARVRALVNWRGLEVTVEPPALRKTEARMRIDVSSMAKGFAVDAISDRLQRLGASNHLVALGGDMKARGAGSAGNGWRVAIEAPAPAVHPIAEVLLLRDAALSTSGNHRNRVLVDHQPAGHIFDPRTGEPVSGSLASVSVMHVSCATSSALATGLFVLGAEHGWAVAREEKIAGLFLIRESDGLVKRPTPEFSGKRE